MLKNSHGDSPVVVVILGTIASSVFRKTMPESKTKASFSSPHGVSCIEKASSLTFCMPLKCRSQDNYVSLVTNRP